MSLESLYAHWGDCKKADPEIKINIEQLVEIMLDFTAYCGSLPSDECGGDCKFCAKNFLNQNFG